MHAMLNMNHLKYAYVHGTYRPLPSPQNDSFSPSSTPTLSDELRLSPSCGRVNGNYSAPSLDPDQGRDCALERQNRAH